MDKIHFEKLTPNTNVDLGIYKEALDFVFENDEIKNIAITGAYSSGKSSIVESYKKQVSDRRFLHISLADFKETEQNYEYYSEDENEKDTFKEQNREKESILEGKILNQLLHQIDVSKIPQTNFKIKKSQSNKNIIIKTIFIIAFIMSGLHIFYNLKWIEFIQSLRPFYSLSFLQITTKGISLFFSGVIFLATFVLGIFNLIKIQDNKSIFKKFSFNGNEIEILESSEESYFDKYLNEVLYLFENSGSDVIVFEDIDRYNMNKIFQRLREINMLVNSKRDLNKNNPLRFFYLVKDDIFVSKDRTKFFDFIIPVVPVMDGSNSYDQFISHLKKGNIFDKFDENFLQGISLYVDDMRILKNIYNEFIIYYKRIGNTEQDYNKLLAIIVYKNIFPKDFSDSQLNKGFISTLFSNKGSIIEDEIREIDDKINELEQLIIKCEEEHIVNIDELEKVYSNYNYHPRIVDYNNPKFIERKKNLELKNNDKLEQIKNEINDFNQKRIELKSKNLSKLITRDNLNKVFDVKNENFIGGINTFNEIKSSQYFDLIKYLIRNGYIDETYGDYMTYFYPNSISKNDKMFLRSITDKKAKDWSYSITSPELVLSRLREVDFDEIESLNFDLLSYILTTQKQNEKYLVRLVNQLKDTKQFKFIKEYFIQTDNISSYVKSINKYWPEFLEEINSTSVFTNSEQKEYILATLYYSNDDEVSKINKDGFLSNLISLDNLFLNINYPKVEKLLDKFISLNIKFEVLNFEDSNRELFDLVCENKLYKLTYKNISIILNNIFGLNDNDIKHRNYSMVMKNRDSKLLEYINENIQLYIDIIIENCDGRILDDKNSVLRLINNKEIDNNSISQYIMLLDTELDLLEEIELNEIWNLLLENNKVKYSIENILYYYFNNDNVLNDTLVNFINSKEIKFEFSQDEIDLKFGDGSSLNIFEALVSNENIEIKAYKKILENFDFIYSTPTNEIKGLSETRIKVLIDLNKFKVSYENIIYLQENYNTLCISFIQKNINRYIEKIDDLPKLSEDELYVLLSSEIDDTFKEKLVLNFEESLCISKINCSDFIKNVIIKNNFNEEELNYVINMYNTSSDLIKTAIINICIKFIDTIIQDDISINYNLLIKIIENGGITDEEKLQLLCANMNMISKNKVEEAIKYIGLSEHQKIFTNGRPQIEINDINRKFLSKCKDRGFISKFFEENGVFKISRKGLKNKIL